MPRHTENLSAAELADAPEEEFTAAEFYGEMFAAQWDDDPNPYHGTGDDW